MPTEKELKGIAEALRPYLQTTEIQNKGGKETMSEFCPTCGASKEHRHLVTDLEIEKDRHQHDLEKAAAERDSAEATNTELTNALKSLQHHIEHYPDSCPDGDNCPTNQALHRIAEQAKKNITPDDLNVNLIGQYFKNKGILGAAKTKKNGEYKPFKDIKTGGK